MSNRHGSSGWRCPVITIRKEFMNYENYETYLVTAFGPLSLHFPLDTGCINIFCGHWPYEQKNCDASDWKNMQA